MPSPGTSPVIQTSRKSIVYRESSWKIHKFSIPHVEPIFDVEILKMKDSLLLWIYASGQRAFTELALGVPAVYKEDGTCERKAASTMLLGPINDTRSLDLAKRLASGLRKYVYVSCNVNMDRFTAPVLEKELKLHINNNAECF